MNYEVIAKAFASLFEDEFRVYRQTVSGSGVVTQGERLIYSGEPCQASHVSRLFSGDGAPNMRGDYGISTDTLTFYHSASVLCEDGDRVVLKKQGLEYEGWAGKTRIYPTHGQTTIRVIRTV